MGLSITYTVVYIIIIIIMYYISFPYTLYGVQCTYNVTNNKLFKNQTRVSLITHAMYRDKVKKCMNKQKYQIVVSF